MNLKNFDLNLLIALDALLSEGSVTGAAERLGMSQPAMSHALRRLRSAFNDPLLVREGLRMELTARAQGLLQPVRRVLCDIDQVLVQGGEFDPSRLDQAITVIAGEEITSTLGAQLVTALRSVHCASHVQFLNLAPNHRRDYLEHVPLSVAIASGEIASASLQHSALYDDRWACLLRKEHPALTAAFDLTGYLAADHLLLTPPTGGAQSSVDNYLAEHKQRRRVSVIVPNATAIPALIAANDLIATLPRRLAHSLCLVPTLTVVDAPLGDLGYPVRLLWHRRNEGDYRHRWVRNFINDLAQAA